MPPRSDSPVELPDGRLVCKPHGLAVCCICTVDYSFLDEVMGDDATDSSLEISSHDSMPALEDIADEIHHEQDAERVDADDGRFIHFGPKPGHLKPDVSALIPKRFVPPLPTDTPQSLFAEPQKNDNHIIGIHFYRFVRRSNPREILIYTDGACLDNGQQNPRAGCGFVFRPSTPASPDGEPAFDGTVSFRLESKCPKGTTQPQTSNRAELRAVIGVLQFRAWYGEGWKRLVIATDSEYVVNGATKWVPGWERNGWLTAKKTPVKNRDSWELLLEEVRKLAEQGVDVLFWWIPRELNKVADEAAKKGASLNEQTQFTKIHGVMV